MKEFRPAQLAANRIWAWLRSSAPGAAAVEFALLVPVIMFGLLGVANYGLAVNEKMELTSAARAGAQLAIANGTNSTSTETDAIKAMVVASTEIAITTADVTTTESYACSDGTSVAVSTDTCADNEPLQYYMTVTASDNDYTLLFLGTTLALSNSVKVRTK